MPEIRRFECGVRAVNKMAEAKTAQEKTDNKSDTTHKNKQKGFNPTFNTFDIFCVLFSLGTFVADLSTGEFAGSIVFVLSLTGVIPSTILV